MCSKCKKTFASTFSLQHHVKSCFTQLASKINLSCEKCEKQFESVKQIKRHMKIHTKMVSCTQCDKIFENVKMLKCHMKTHTCHICNKNISKNNKIYEDKFY